jgi:hypothetical protein
MTKWNNQDVVQTVNEIKISKLDVGLYGFTKPAHETLPLPTATCLSKPVSALTDDDRNLAVFARV